MAPPSGTTDTSSSSLTENIDRPQSIFVIRHGDRWDYSHPEWKETAERKGDPSLSTLGHRQAREVGQYLDKLFVKEGIKAEDITLISSPFLRCVQTSNELLSEFRHCGDVAETVLIKPEYSVFEFDLYDHRLHDSLPSVAERKNYFPRLDISHESTFIPKVPESVDDFLKRCDDAMEHLDRVHGSTPVLIVVTHAACCIGFVKAAAKMRLQEINPAAPCSIYRLTRSKESVSWEIDHHTKENGMNGFTGHLSDIGEHTIPWNHFDRKAKGSSSYDSGYTGPNRSSK